MLQRFITKKLIVAFATILITVLIAFNVDIQIPCSILDALSIPVDECK